MKDGHLALGEAKRVEACIERWAWSTPEVLWSLEVLEAWVQLAGRGSRILLAPTHNPNDVTRCIGLVGPVSRHDKG